MELFYDCWNREWERYLTKNRVKWVVSESRDIVDSLFQTKIKQIISYYDSAFVILDIHGKEVKLKRRKGDSSILSSIFTVDPWEIVSVPKKINEKYCEEIKKGLEEISIDTMIQQVKEEIEQETLALKDLLNCKISDISPTKSGKKIIVCEKEYLFLEEEEKIKILTNYVYLMGLGIFLQQNGFTVRLRIMERDYGKKTDWLIKKTVEHVLNKKETFNQFHIPDINFDPIVSYVKEKVEHFENNHLIGEYNGFYIYEKEKIENVLL